MHFYYSGESIPYQDTRFPVPLPPNVSIQNGWSQDVLVARDRHLFSINYQTGDDAELYAFFPSFQTYLITPGNPTMIVYTTNSIRTLQNPIRIYVSGITGGCSILNGNYLATVLSQTPGVGGTSECSGRYHRFIVHRGSPESVWAFRAMSCLQFARRAALVSVLKRHHRRDRRRWVPPERELGAHAGMVECRTAEHS